MSVCVRVCTARDHTAETTVLHCYRYRYYVGIIRLGRYVMTLYTTQQCNSIYNKRAHYFT
jgi:hypothetical protein